MEFRYHDIICWIFPGIYFMGMLILNDFILHLGIIIPENISCETYTKFDQGAIVTALVFCIPVFGLVVGYVLNYCASLLECFSYAIYDKCKYIGLWRASERILNGKARRSKVDELDTLKNLLDNTSQRMVTPPSKRITEPFTNKTAEEYLTRAKQGIDIEKMSTFYYKCTFGRNLSFAQTLIFLIILLYCISCGFLSNINNSSAKLIFFIDLLLVFVYFFAWRRNLHTYVKYCFVDYLKNHNPKPNANI